MAEHRRFSATVVDDYIHLKTWGELDVEDLEAPAQTALALAREHHIIKLLDDISQIDSSAVSMRIQTKSMGIIWKLRKFKKVALVIKNSRVQRLFFATLDVLHLNLNSQFKSFSTEAEALAWLKNN
jgi:ABC-type transporter Mla MlaB component